MDYLIFALLIAVIPGFIYLAGRDAGREQKIFDVIRNRFRVIPDVRLVYYLRDETFSPSLQVWIIVDEVRPEVLSVIQTTQKKVEEEVKRCRLIFHVVQSGNGDSGFESILRMRCLYRRDALPFEGPDAPTIENVVSRIRGMR